MVDAGRFAMLRLSRLYPLHLVTLLAVVLLQLSYRRQTGLTFVYGDFDWPHFLLQLGLASHWLPGATQNFNGPIWSISVEMLVYALFFLIIRVAGHVRYVAALVVVAGLILSISVSGSILSCIIFFFAGGICVEWHRRLRDAPAAARHMAAAAAVLLPMGVAIWGAGWPPIVHAYLLIVYAMLAVLAASFDPACVQRWARPIAAAGDMTYASYLIHFPLQLAIVVGFGAAGVAVPASSPVLFIAYLGAVLAGSILVFRHFERPAQRAIRHWAARGRAGSASLRPS